MNELQLKPEEELRGIAERINTIKEQTKAIALQASIEIGRQLFRAKKLVPHGSWGGWLQEHVDYSQRTASNLIRVYEEYGEGQQTLFGKTMDRQTLANLSYTQAVALLAIADPDERAEFAETMNVTEMSTRELEEAIKSRDEATRELGAAKEKAKELETRLESLRQEEKEKRAKLQAEKDKLEKDYASAWAEAKSLEKELEELKKETSSGNNQEERIKELTEELRQAAEKASCMEKQLKEERDKPIEAVTVKEDTEETKAEMERLRQQIAELKARPQNEEIATEVEANICISEIKKPFNRLMELLGEMPKDKKEKYHGAVIKLLEILKDAAERAGE